MSLRHQVVSEGWPTAILPVLDSWKAGPVCYVGGLENYPTLIEAIADRHPLWGNPGAVLRTVRDPFLLGERLGVAGFATPEVRVQALGLPQDGTWLEKPVASGGGVGIRAWDRSTADQRRAEPVYYQKRVIGSSLGASFLADRHSRCVPLGVCHSWQGSTTTPFIYLASLGPIRLNMASFHQIARIGNFLTQQFGLKGLFGVDLIRDYQGQIHVLEVNPRMTASLEVLERATGQSFFRYHIQAFSGDPVSLEQLPPEQAVQDHRVGKAVIYAAMDCRVPLEDPPAFRRALEYIRSNSLNRKESAADVPLPGTWISRGEPVCTVFAKAPSLLRLEQRLRRKVNLWARRLATPEWSQEGIGFDT